MSASHQNGPTQRHGRRPTQRPCRHSGFTLLEVLLAVVLATTLMAGVWSLFSIFIALFEKGQAKTEQSQLARSLMQQISDDLRSAIDDSPIDDGPGAASDPSGGQGVRRFGLLGSAHELRFDVLQVTTLPESLDPQRDAAEQSRRPFAASSAMASTSTVEVPELRTIIYTFRKPEELNAADPDSLDPNGVDSSDRNARPGLTRRELDYETPSVGQGASPLDRATAGSETLDTAISDAANSDTATADEQMLAELIDESVTWVPEIADLQFRYFDGSSWSSEWNSLDRKSLPVAVEVVMQVMTFEEYELQREAALDAAEGSDEIELEEHLTTDNELDLEDALSGTESVTSADAPKPRPTFRLVIDLPSAQSRPALQPAADTMEPMTLDVPRSLRVPSLTPRPLVLRPQGSQSGSSGASQSDRWMRSGPM